MSQNYAKNVSSKEVPILILILKLVDIGSQNTQMHFCQSCLLYFLVESLSFSNAFHLFLHLH